MSDSATRVLRLVELPPGSARTVRFGGRAVLLVNDDGDVRALEAGCPHAGGDLGQGRVQGRHIACPLHGSRFDVRDGSVDRGPATAPLATYAVRIADGWIEVSL